MTKYTQTKDVKVTLPVGIYNEMLKIIQREQRWAYPQNFIIEAIYEKIDRWKKENPEKG